MPIIDPVAFSFALAAVLLCAVVGILVPAIRAARVSPAIALGQPS
jgi:ABC-type antimicrobial peptide transport system permease subunit